MPRKKKRAPPAPASVPEVGEAEVLPLNRAFAERYDAAKRRELLAHVPAGVLEGSDESESESESEDEFGELLTRGIDRGIRETLEAVRKRDPKIYDAGVTFFGDKGKGREGNGSEAEDEGGNGEGSDDEQLGTDDEPVAGWGAIERAESGALPKMTIKDYVRETLLRDGRLSDGEDNDEEEAGERRTSIGEGMGRKGEYRLVSFADDDKSVSGDDTGDDEEQGEDADGDFFKKKSKSQADIEQEEEDFEHFMVRQAKKQSRNKGEELLLHSYLENEKPDEKERFLRDFVLNNGWLDRNASQAPAADDYALEVDAAGSGDDDDGADVAEAGEEDFDEKVDQFEAKYNFRFEEPEGEQVVTHAREIPGSMRRPDDRRKRAREARKLRKEKEKLSKTEDIKMLKNMKKREVQARLLAIQDAAGNDVDLSGMDLDADFDPDEFSRQMESKFGDDYYKQEDKDMKGLKKEGVAVASEHRLPAKHAGVADEGDDAVHADVDRLMDEYYNLDYEDIVGGVPVRFNYKRVEPDSFRMTAEEILIGEDKELNQRASLKYLAPYRNRRETKKSMWRASQASGANSSVGRTDRRGSGKDARFNGKDLHPNGRDTHHNGKKRKRTNEPEADASVGEGAHEGNDVINEEKNNAVSRKEKKKKRNKKEQEAVEENAPSKPAIEEGGGLSKSARKRQKRKERESGSGLSKSRLDAYNISA